MTRKSPRRYFSGLSKSATRRRRGEIAKFGSMGSRNRRAYVGFQTDKGRRTRRSKYTERWTKAFPKAKSLEERAAASGAVFIWFDVFSTSQHSALDIPSSQWMIVFRQAIEKMGSVAMVLQPWNDPLALKRAW